MNNIGRYGYYGGITNVSTYLLLIIPAFILSIVAQIAIKRAYSKYSAIQNSRNISGAEAAMRILQYYNISNVRIEMCSGKLSDHYDPRSNVIRLSESVYKTSSVAAVGVACHEAGHAVQHALNYSPIKIRNKIIPICNIGSYAGIPLALLGFWLGIEPLVWIGLILYSFIMIFQLVTLPVEIDASKRAINVIEEIGLLNNGDELNGAKHVLICAAMTYVAALAVTLANLLRFVILLTGRRK